MSNGDTFALNISAFVKKTKGNADRVIRKTLLDLGRRVVELSPVGNPELWAINQVALMNRESYQLWRESTGKKRVTAGTLRSKFGLHSPKGYVGGRFRANWQYGVDAPPVSTLYDTKTSAYPNAAQALGAMASGIGAASLARQHFIVNNLPYAQRLEDGWSSQAPAGMVAITVMEFQQFVDNAVKSL